MARWEAEATANRLNKELMQEVLKYKQKSLALVEVALRLQEHLLHAQTEIDEAALIAHYVERPRRKTQTVDLENFCPEGLSNPLSSPRRGLLLCSTIR
jgi:uncharacterized protein with von Willebrand factor type A (vWA) domain